MHILRKHPYYYAVAGLIQLSGLMAVTFFADSQQMKMVIIVLMTLAFTAWALLHHYVDHDLHPKVVVEYVLMGSLGISLAFFVLH